MDESNNLIKLPDPPSRSEQIQEALLRLTEVWEKIGILLSEIAEAERPESELFTEVHTHLLRSIHYANDALAQAERALRKGWKTDA